MKGKEHLFLAAFKSFEEKSTEYKGIQTEDTLNANITSFFVYYCFSMLIYYYAKHELKKKEQRNTKTKSRTVKNLG